MTPLNKQARRFTWQGVKDIGAILIVAYCLWWLVHRPTPPAPAQNSEADYYQKQISAGVDSVYPGRAYSAEEAKVLKALADETAKDYPRH